MAELAEQASIARVWSTGLGVSVGIHGAVATCALVVMLWSPTQSSTTAPPAMAIELAPEPAGPVTPPHDTPPEPQPRPRPAEQVKKLEIPDLPRMAKAPDSATLPTKAPPPPPERVPPPPPPSAQNPAPRAKAAAPATGQPTNGASNAQQSWEGRVLARLEQKKRYPAEARRDGLEDTVYVRITIDRRGRVLASSIVRSRRYGVLDDAVRDLVRRADPLPALPDSMDVDQYTVTVPVDFYIKKRA